MIFIIGANPKDALDFGKRLGLKEYSFVDCIEKMKGISRDTTVLLTDQYLKSKVFNDNDAWKYLLMNFHVIKCIELS